MRKPLKAILDVNHQPVAVPHYLVQVRSEPPTRWSVVPRPKRTGQLTLDWGPHYGVCPSCRERAALHGKPRRRTGGRCHGEFAVA